MRIFSLFTVVLVAVAASSSYAQVGYVTTTLEGMVAGSDVVVRARVERVVRGPVRDERCWEIVTLSVVETIRGSQKNSLTFSHQVLASDRIFEAWKDAGREHLWFFDHKDGKGEPNAAGEGGRASGSSLRLTRVVRLGPPVPAEAGFGPPGQGPWGLPVFHQDLTLLEKPEAILRAARAAAAEWGGRKPQKIHFIDLPHTVMARSGRSGDANRLEVPVCPHLEMLARRMIASPGDFVSRSDFPAPKDEDGRKHVDTWLGFTRDLLRLEGVRALSRFRSEANIALLKPLLSDPATRGLNKTENGALVLDEGVPVTIGREYYVRKEAYETLRGWGVEVDRPETEVLGPPS